MFRASTDFPSAEQVFSRFDDLFLNPTLYPSSRYPDRRCVFPSKNKDLFKLLLNIKHFNKDEVQVKTVDNAVVIHAKHEEQPDEHGFVSREFTRRFPLPDNVDPVTVNASISQEGMLTISAPIKKPDPPASNERIIEIAIQSRVSKEDANILAQESISRRKEEAEKESQSKQQDKEKQEAKSQPQDAEKSGE